jgi:hypothetical protein
LSRSDPPYKTGLFAVSGAIGLTGKGDTRGNRDGEPNHEASRRQAENGKGTRQAGNLL